MVSDMAHMVLAMDHMVFAYTAYRDKNNYMVMAILISLHVMVDRVKDLLNVLTIWYHIYQKNLNFVVCIYFLTQYRVVEM